MKIPLLIVTFLSVLGSSLFAAEPVAITVIEDFSDPKDNPQFNTDVATVLVALSQSHPLILSYRVVEESSEAQAPQAKFEPFTREMPTPPQEGLRLGDYQRAVAKFQADLAAWKNGKDGYLQWRETQKASAQAWLAGALRKQTETSQRFARELARRRGDYRRSDVCGAVLTAAKADFPPGHHGYLILVSDLKDQPLGRAGRTTPLKELPPEITLVLAHPSATRSPLIAGLPNRVISAPTLAEAVKLVSAALTPTNPTALAEGAPPSGTP
ncbi:MAG: hypothetical protein ABJF10_06270 [Chthoniobacter sp.]|uniref:hypothetical protein n=1 Tax=Chthoniobacter sp. TaxID=2510640 RepID=UPI0032A345FC